MFLRPLFSQEAGSPTMVVVVVVVLCHPFFWDNVQSLSPLAVNGLYLFVSPVWWWWCCTTTHQDDTDTARVPHRRRERGTNFFVLWIFPRRWWVAVCAERRFIVKRFYVFYDFYEIIISRLSSLLVVLVKSVCVRVLAEMLLSGDAVFLNAAPTPRDTSIWIWPSSRVKGWTQFERVFF